MSVYYAGIGARKTPDDVLKKMKSAAKTMAKAGFTLRSGGAKGADEAFEEGCTEALGAKEIYLPYPKFRGNKSSLNSPTREARMFASKYHPNWANLGNVGREFMARNVYQVLGEDFNTPSAFILCWTPKGAEVGGTSQAIRIAKDYDIQILNFASHSDEEISEFILNLI